MTREWWHTNWNENGTLRVQQVSTRAWLNASEKSNPKILLFQWGQGSSEPFERDLHLRRGRWVFWALCSDFSCQQVFREELWASAQNTSTKDPLCLNPTSQKLNFKLFWQLFIPVILSQTRTSTSIAVISSCRLFVEYRYNAVAIVPCMRQQREWTSWCWR